MLRTRGSKAYAVFSILKSLRVLQKVRTKIMTRANYTYLFFLIHTLSCRFSQQIGPLTTVQLCILQDYSSERIVFRIANATRYLQHTPC